MAEQAEQLRRIEIPFFDGVNSLVADNISKKNELSHCENARSKTIGSIEKRPGTRRLGNTIVATNNLGLFYFDNDTETGFFRISTVGATTSIYYLNSSANWTILSGGGTGLTAAKPFSYTIAENYCFLVNGTDNNRYIKSDGTTVVASDSTAISNHLYNSPKAYIINNYKDRLYLGDYTVGSTRYKNGIMMSSTPVGIVSLVDGDHAAIAIDSVIKVTDTKYIRAADTLDVYRGGTKIADITIDAKTEDTITIATVTMAVGTDFNSSDEIWVDGTYTGTKVFRWADNPSSGIDVKQYDTFKLSGGQNDSITMMTNIGDVQMIGNKNNLAVWNNYSLQNFDLGIGCVSKNGYVKSKGTLFFLDYSGIYSTTGGIPKLVSSKVQKYIDGATTANLEAAAAGKKGLSVVFAIGNVTLYHPDGSTNKTLSDVVLEYDLRTTNWYVHTGITATQFATYTTSTDADRLEYSSTDTNYLIKEFLLDTAMVDGEYIDNDEILFRADTNNITLSKEFDKVCYPKEIIIESERGSGIQCFISMDDAQFFELKGTARKGITVLKIHNKDGESLARCRKIKLSIRDYTKARCKISRVAITYITSQESENQNDVNYNN